MQNSLPLKALFLDIGGVFLTNGWDRRARAEAAGKFSLDLAELNERHHIIFDAFEAGKMTFDDYLDLLVVNVTPYPKEALREFIYQQSHAFPEMISFIRKVKQDHGLKLIAVNNEARELNDYRIKQFGLDTFIDAFVSSCYVHVRKPDQQIYQYALDIGHLRKEEVIYIDDRLVFIQAAQRLGIEGIQHVSLEGTRRALEERISRVPVSG
ncbi:HAD-IA family hydrolase [Flavihumibacter petaseus]|uniref:Putative hydrolase n=1 Tax=Flavihumibacter petaseus NBRC 106054 TaxID=1220578 RepID=A0A0E9MW17_9BACT|nr:HAD-IA family hydrolase [Flavihumibacter petaseus]GAO41616.1 putative hydrolase [Flavihumibacter petaseus NBRC 106054]